VGSGPHAQVLLARGNGAAAAGQAFGAGINAVSSSFSKVPGKPEVTRNKGEERAKSDDTVLC